MTAEKKRILILTADAGFGHRSAAIALEQAVLRKYGDLAEVMLVNPLDEKKAPILLKESQSDYDVIVKKAPEIYRLGYEASDTRVPKTIMESALTVLLFEVMRDVLNRTQPDVILSTYPLYSAALDAVFTIRQKRIPVISVVTDLVSVHQIWFNKDVDLCIVPNEIVKNKAYQHGLRASQIEEAGIPVHPDFGLVSKDKVQLRRELGWEEDLLTILVVASKRTENITEKLNLLNHSGFNFQLIMIAGKDQALYEELNAIEWHHPVKIYNFVNEMPKFLAASDLNICKAGGLIVTESLASGLPMLLVDVLPGQEVGNADFVIENQLGYQIKSNTDFLEQIYHLLENDCAALKTMQINAKNMGKPMAAENIAAMAWKFADYGVVENRRKDEKRLRSLLESFKIQI